MQNKNMKKKLLYYEKGSFDEFVKKFSKGEDNVYSISYLTDKNIALRYTAINGVEHFIIDITVMVMSALARNDLRIIYESWISLLNEENESNIDYCVEKSFLSEACDIFSYYFERNEECDKVMSQIEEIKEDNNEESKIFSIVNCDKNEFNSVVEQFEKQLYGHENFKENFKKQLEAFILLNKMKRRKVFSLLICGKSGVGKTEVGRILQRQMYPDDLPIKINFGNYSGKGSLWSLIGSPKGYVGSEQGGELTNKILHSKSKIIVIDE